MALGQRTPRRVRWSEENGIEEAELAFPNWNLPFHLYSDASDRQLGATLVQNGKPLGFYTRKLNAAQLNYSVGEKELLGIVEVMKAFEGMVRGFKVIIHTDHLNLLYSKMPNQRMMRWRLLLEDFHPIVTHIAGDNNLSAEWEPPSKRLSYSNDPHVEMLHSMLELDYKDDTYDESLYEMTDEQEEAEDSFALSLSRMQRDQQNDRAFNDEVEKLLR